jgi:hypothetical protein
LADLRLQTIVTFILPAINTLFISGLGEVEHAKGENSNRTAYIAGGVTAGIGAVVIAIIVILLLLRYRKVCFTTKPTRFPFDTNHDLTISTLTRNSLNNMKSDSNLDSDKEQKKPAMSEMLIKKATHDTAEYPDFRRGIGQTLSKQFLTDGHERSVHFNYKVTLYGYDSDYKPETDKCKSNSDVEQMFMI